MRLDMPPTADFTMAEFSLHFGVELLVGSEQSEIGCRGPGDARNRSRRREATTAQEDYRIASG